MTVVYLIGFNLIDEVANFDYLYVFLTYRIFLSISIHEYSFSSSITMLVAFGALMDWFEWLGLAFFVREF